MAGRVTIHALTDCLFRKPNVDVNRGYSRLAWYFGIQIHEEIPLMQTAQLIWFNRTEGDNKPPYVSKLLDKANDYNIPESMFPPQLHVLGRKTWMLTALKERIPQDDIAKIVACRINKR